MAVLPDQLPSSSNEESRSATPDNENVQQARNLSLRKRLLKSCDLEALAKQLGYLCKYEIIHQPESTIKVRMLSILSHHGGEAGPGGWAWGCGQGMGLGGIKLTLKFFDSNRLVKS